MYWDDFYMTMDGNGSWKLEGGRKTVCRNDKILKKNTKSNKKQKSTKTKSIKLFFNKNFFQICKKNVFLFSRVFKDLPILTYRRHPQKK